MAPKTIAVPLSAATVRERLLAYARAAERGIESRALPNGERFVISGTGGAGLNVYPSKGGGCRVVFDRPDDPAADAIAALLEGAEATPARSKKVAPPVSPVLDDAPCWIGSDESGKGDYFGPLVVAAVALDERGWRVLETLGVRDSKALADARAIGLAGDIRSAFPHEILTVMPARYNELWQKMGSVNRVLAWAHARAIENVAERVPEATAAVADQFGDEALIRDALFRKGRTLKLVQMPRAERDPAVAAASILARAEFLRRLDVLSRSAGVALPKGASAAVDAAARALVRNRGADYLRGVAKLHFQNTRRVLP